MTSLADEALVKLLGRVVAEARKDFQREREIMAAEYRATISELRAEVSDLKRSLTEAALAVRDGAPGADGLPGQPGPAGEPGVQGPPGSLPIVKSFSLGDVCYLGDVVTHAGCTWQALKDTATQPDFGADGWILLAASGADAREGEVCGLFDESRAYRKFDVVTLDGSEFRAVKDAPGPCPGDGWRQSASKGKRGEKGLPGDRGLPGLPGRSIKSASLEGGVLIFDYSDGQSDAIDLSIIAKGSRG